MCLSVWPALKWTVSASATVAETESLWGIDWTAVGGVGTALAAVVAIWALMAARADGHERTRPVVIVEYRPPRSYRAMDLAVRNIGASAAHDVEVKFDPPIRPDPPETQGLSERQVIIERYKDAIPFLGPGQQLSNVVTFDLEDEDLSDLPHDMTVEVSYRESKGRRRYTESYRLLTSVAALETSTTNVDPIQRELRDIRRSIDAVKGKLGQTRR